MSGEGRDSRGGGRAAGEVCQDALLEKLLTRHLLEAGKGPCRSGPSPAANLC